MFKSAITIIGKFISGLTIEKLKQYGLVALIFLFLALFGYIGILRLKLRNAEINLIIANQNVASLADRIHKIATRSGDSETVKIALLVNKVKDLEALNASLAKKAKDQPGQIHMIEEVGLQVDHAPVSTEAKITGGIAPFHFIDSTKGRRFDMSGTVTLHAADSARIALERLRLQLVVLTGITTIDGKLHAYAQCENPDVSIFSIESASFDVPMLIKPPGRFWLGVKCLGIGIMIGAAATELVNLYLDRKTKP